MPDQKSFAGRVALVTGGTRGIGREIVLELARRGADVAFNYAKSADAAESLKKELEALGVRSFAAQCNVTDTEAAIEMVRQIKDTFDRLDILVNNAGITRDNLILRMKESDWDEVLDTDLKGAWNFSRAALRVMLRQGGGGRILNISSASGVCGMAGQSNYSAAKAGLHGLTKALAKEVASRAITVNALAPGFVKTEMTVKLEQEYAEKFRREIPLARFAEADEMARIAVFLVSDDASYITGQVIRADGGFDM
jgi:3-oxoacyl-[acyl-carrier protein] reductase